ncbi:MAG: hypothetical protein PHW22_03355 [Bacilli bacterium]|nr:hypothetical protein [Bacilli bacterium]
MKKKNLLILSITALSTLVMGACGTTTSSTTGSTSTPTTSQTTSEESTSDEVTSEVTTSEEVTSEESTSSEEETSEETSSTPVVETYSVEVTVNDKVTVTVDKAEAKAGETVTVSVGQVADDNVLVKVEVLKADDSAVEVTAETDGTYTFIMPESDVSVHAVTRELAVNTVSYNSDDNIAISGDESAKEGDSVTIKVAYTDGFALDKINATSGDTEVALTAVSPVEYSFTMPMGAVEVSATSKAATTNDYSNKIYRGSINYDDDTAYGYQVDYQFTFRINTLTIASLDNADEYTDIVFEKAPFFYDEDLKVITAYTASKTYVFNIDNEAGSDKLIYKGGFETMYEPSSDSSSFSVYYPRSNVFTNVAFELEVAYLSVGATEPVQQSEYTFGVSVRDAYLDDYMVGAVRVVKRGDNSVQVPLTDNGDGTYTFIVPAFDVELQADSIELVKIVGHKYNTVGWYEDSYFGDSVSYSMSVEFFADGVADFEYTSDVSSDNISAADASYIVDSVNRTISVTADSKTFAFAFLSDTDLNQISLTSTTLGIDFDNVKLSDRRFIVSLVDNDHVEMTLNSTAYVFANETKEFSVSVADGYEFKSISAADASGADVELTEVTEGTDYKVVMPYSDVFITVVTAEIPAQDAPVLGLKYSAEVTGYTDYVDDDTYEYEKCNYNVSFDFISKTEVTIVAYSTTGFTTGTPDDIDETVAYTYDFDNGIVTIEGSSSKTLTYNSDGTLTCNYKLSTNIDGTRNAIFTAPVVIPVSGKSYTGTADGTNDDNWDSSPYECTFDFTSDSQVHIKMEIKTWDNGGSENETVSYTYDASTKTITIDGNSSKTLTVNSDGSLTCHYKVDTGGYVDFTGVVFSLNS